ncbi:PLP-dependent aminotransferase family protein [Candidatus Latescibacterota bacterium]
MRVFDFGSGYTNPLTFPVAGLAEVAGKAIESVGAEFTRYPGDLGHRGLREVLAARERKREGVEVDADHIALTNGSMQGVTLVAEALTNGPGDVVLTEELTYSGTIGAYRRMGLKMVGVALDEHGMRVDDLEGKIAALQDEGVSPRFIYALTTYQNPTGSVMPRSRRAEMIEVARRCDCPVVEDNCYGDVHFEGEVEPSLYAMDDSPNLIYLCSLSKILGPGVRMGYLMARPPMLGRLLERRFDGGNSLLAAAVLSEFFRDHLWDHVERTNAALKEKRDALFVALEESVGDICSWSQPVGGLFVWVDLPEDVDRSRLAELAAERNVRYARGSAFHVRGEDVPNLRLAFGYCSLEDIREGIPQLAECIRAARRGSPAATATAAEAATAG